MSYNEIIEDLQKCSRCEIPTRVPLLPISHEFAMRTAGMTYRQDRTELEKVVKMNCDGVEKFGYDWALIFPDDYIEWEPFGMEMLEEEDIPVIPRKYLPATQKTFNNMVFPDIHKDGRMPFHLEAIRRVREKLDTSKCVGSRVAAPFSSVGLLLGTDALLFNVADNPGFIKDAMDKITDFIIEWGLAQRKAGVDILWVGDCLASGQFISPDTYAEMALPYTEKVVRELKKSGVFLIYHTSERSIEHIKLQCQLSVDAVNLHESVDITEIKKMTGHKKCLMGNLNPIGLLRDGSLDEIRKETRKMIEKNKQGGGYIFCTAEGITESTPIENMMAMMEAAREAAPY